jgi:hypothetical protein
MDRLPIPDRLDPKAILMRYHARHDVRQLTCPLCVPLKLAPSPLAPAATETAAASA